MKAIVVPEMLGGGALRRAKRSHIGERQDLHDLHRAASLVGWQLKYLADFLAQQGFPDHGLIGDPSLFGNAIPSSENAVSLGAATLGGFDGHH